MPLDANTKKDFEEKLTPLIFNTGFLFRSSRYLSSILKIYIERLPANERQELIELLGLKREHDKKMFEFTEEELKQNSETEKVITKLFNRQKKHNLMSNTNTIKNNQEKLRRMTTNLLKLQETECKSEIIKNLEDDIDNLTEKIEDNVKRKVEAESNLKNQNLEYEKICSQNKIYLEQKSKKVFVEVLEPLFQYQLLLMPHKPTHKSSILLSKEIHNKNKEETSNTNTFAIEQKLLEALTLELDNFNCITSITNKVIMGNIDHNQLKEAFEMIAFYRMQLLNIEKCIKENLTQMEKEVEKIRFPNIELAEEDCIDDIINNMRKKSKMESIDYIHYLLLSNLTKIKGLKSFFLFYMRSDGNKIFSETAQKLERFEKELEKITLEELKIILKSKKADSVLKINEDLSYPFLNLIHKGNEILLEKGLNEIVPKSNGFLGICQFCNSLSNSLGELIINISLPMKKNKYIYDTDSADRNSAMQTLETMLLSEQKEKQEAKTRIELCNLDHLNQESSTVENVQYFPGTDLKKFYLENLESVSATAGKIPTICTDL